MKKYLLILLAVMINSTSGMAQDAWQASWIGAIEKPAANEAPSQKVPTIVITKALYLSEIVQLLIVSL